jgi:hypothetical protein
VREDRSRSTGPRIAPKDHLLRSALEGAGIRALIEGNLLQGAVGEIPAGWTTSLRIMVEERDAAHARALLERWGTLQAAEGIRGMRFPLLWNARVACSMPGAANHAELAVAADRAGIAYGVP